MDSPSIHESAPPTVARSATPMLGRQDMAVLQVFLECRGRVVSRAEIARRAGLSGLNQRRCDSILVSLRRVLGADSLRTVRGRGWMLEESALEQATRLTAA